MKRVVTSILAISLLQGCSNYVVDQDGNLPRYQYEVGKHRHNRKKHTHVNPISIEHDLMNRDFIKLKKMFFKLAPHIKAGEPTHLDFYFRDYQDKHVSGASVNLMLISPKHHGEYIELIEDVPGEHYHCKVKLKDRGEYQSIVQVSKDGLSYSPKFIFEYNTGKEFLK